jgi:hypothetical protein
VAAADRLSHARIRAARGDLVREWRRLYALGAEAGNAIVRASNAVGAGRVVEGRPVKIRACSVAGCGGWIDGAGWHIKIPRKGWRPTRLGGAWVWSTAAHDPRPCASATPVYSDPVDETQGAAVISHTYGQRRRAFQRHRL